MGYPKSGNFWLYQILEEIMKRSGNWEPSFIQQHPIQDLAQSWELNYPTQSEIDMIDITDLQVVYRISSIFRMPITDLSEYLQNTNHVWTHSPICSKSGEIFNLFDKKIYIIRDPRDVIISASRYYCSPYMIKYFPQEEKDPEKFLKKNLQRLLHEWVWHVWDHLRLRKKYDLHISFFEGFKLDFQRELSLLLKYLEIQLSAEEKLAIEQAVSFQEMKKENPRHLKKGKSGYWMQQLSGDQIEQADRIAGPLMEYLGYPNKNEDMKFSRRLPSYDFERLKKSLIISQNQ
jgi:aryl sulfotransferase